MPMIWDDRFATGVPGVDHDHQHLFAIFNRLEDAVHQAKSKQAIEAILVELAEYTGYHFRREEDFMKEQNWSGYEQHKHAHDGLLEVLGTLIYNFERGETHIEGVTLSFLEDWLVEHTQVMDKELLAVVPA